MPTQSIEIHGTSLIGFSAADTSKDASKAINPATGEEIDPPFSNATDAEVEKAASLAWDAFLVYSKKSGKERAAFINEIATQIEAIAPAITERAMEETGLPEPRFAAVEIPRTCNQLRLFAKLIEDGSWSNPRIDTAIPDRAPLPKADIRSMLRPLGPVTVFAASNFPLAFSAAGGDTASALAAGCPVIVKAHSSHPGTSELVARAIQKAAQATGMPEGVYSLLFGGGRTVGAALVKHPKIKAVGFTGSTAGGTQLMKIASERKEPIPVYAEMGSINPLVLLPGAIAERGDAIAGGLQISSTIGVGQFCTKPGLVLLKNDSDGNAFVDTFTAKMKETAGQVMLNPGIHKAYRSSVESRKTNDKVKTLVANVIPEGAASCLGTTAVFEVSAATFLADESLSHEIFGPGVTLVRYSDKTELLAVLENLEGQLTGTVHATDADLADYAEVVPVLERKVGRVIFNGYPTGVEVCPSIVHGGPFPATSDGRSTSVGTNAIERFTRLIAYQSSPQALLPDELKDGNPLNILRLVDGKSQK